ncbi:MAG TPA: protein kinase [Kofleriaceae bacterium]|nr:protein kinase [Kofleriaceae bacterium]
MRAGPTEAFGPYLVYEQLGAGGMARVDRAELAGIEGFHRSIALKRMLPHVATNQDMVQAFVREARLASQLRHANVAQTYELGKVDGIYFIAMELVTGPTLRAILKHCARTTGPMPVPIALNILNQICDALDYAHNLCDESGQPLGIIHRDVSPSNVIVDEAGVTKLIDFGIAKASAAGMQTMSGTIKGKFGYMAPEYLVGAIDARADLFAVGVIAHELLTNRPLFSVADDMETLRRVRGMPLRPPSQGNPNVPPEIDDLVMTALARDPDRRWQHATALRTALTTLTRRLGLVCTNQQVVEWVTWAFDHTRPRGTRLPAHAPPAEASDPSLSAVTRPDLPTAEPHQPDPVATTLLRAGAAPPPAVRARSASDPPRPSGPINVTLLDGAAALRGRSSSPSVPPPLANASPAAPPALQPPTDPMPREAPLAAAPPERRTSAAVIVVLVLLAAALAAAGVYLVLPYLT